MTTASEHKEKVEHEKDAEMMSIPYRDLSSTRKELEMGNGIHVSFSKVKRYPLRSAYARRAIRELREELSTGTLQKNPTSVESLIERDDLREVEWPTYVRGVLTDLALAYKDLRNSTFDGLELQRIRLESCNARGASFAGIVASDVSIRKVDATATNWASRD